MGGTGGDWGVRVLRKVRIASQSVFLVLFSASVFLLAVHPTGYSWPSHWFLRLNPLVALVTEVAARSVILPLLIMGLATAVLTVLFGRFFCGFVCPLGTCIDLSDRFLLNRSYNEQRRPPRYFQRIKYVVLVMVLVVALFGATLPLVLDPVSILTRISTLVAFPFIRVAGSDAAAVLQSTGLESFSRLGVSVPQFYGSWLAALFFLLVVAGGPWDKRFWCQYVCPSGAMFAVLSRFSLWRRHVVAEGCNQCKRCFRACPTRAIEDKKVEKTSVAECIECGLCVSLKDTCTRFELGRQPGADVVGADVRRRHVLGGLLAGFALVPMYRSNAIARRDLTGR